ncbi:MAG: 5'/3'-nucleotidase SurE, partial [Candidatus Dormibacteraeota bacterium]|nr:5'/3'-nucleotidase SurE [Candidatus Dormibacteraeota bacterium]
MTLRALVTNDDGIDSEGLRQLALAAVGAGLDVTVAAPQREASGSSAALNATQSDGRIVVEPRELPGLDGVPCYAVAAAPAFIVLIGQRGAFGAVPQLVLSGINRGANLGNAIIHSGTVGATLTAGTYGLRALAVSCDSASPQHWETSAEFARRVLPGLIAAVDALVLNLNVPDREVDEVRGIVRAHLAGF